MKLNKKFVYGSIASILAISPMLPAVMPSNTEVLAAKTDTITLNHNSYVYTAQGKRTYYNGKGTLRMGTTVNGNAKTTSINGKSYYPLTGGAYVKAANVGVVNKQVQDGNLELNYNSYVYDKNGKRLYKFRGSKKNTHLRKGTPLKYSGSVEKIDRNSKQYFLVNDDNYNQSWLPYKKIGGKYYYNIGAGGYVNAANVGQIDNKPLYTTDVSVKVNTTSAIRVGTGKERTSIKPGEKVKVDRVSQVLSGPSYRASYRISGTKTGFFATSIVNKKPRQQLLNYTYFTYVSASKNIDAYDANGQARSNLTAINGATTSFAKGTFIPVDEVLYIWNNKENKAELYYHLAPNTTVSDISLQTINKDSMTFVKAADSEFVSGPLLKPVNTVDEAKADAKVATETDKQDLQKAINQDEKVKASENYQQYRHETYDAALAYAKQINSSNTASLQEVKQITLTLKNQQNSWFLPADELKVNSELVLTKPL